MLRLYDNHLSGNGYKPRLLLSHLGLTYERIEVDIMKGETRTPEFLARNTNGRIPFELDDGAHIAESNAILFYLAEGLSFLPSAPDRRVAFVVVPKSCLRGQPRRLPSTVTSASTSASTSARS